MGETRRVKKLGEESWAVADKEALEFVNDFVEYVKGKVEALFVSSGKNNVQIQLANNALWGKKVPLYYDRLFSGCCVYAESRQHQHHIAVRSVSKARNHLS